ncbi:MAG: hypothetical protein M9951_11135 [Burkholderiaceae bacterium]|nr:hypothetical protein [Burkholderiaceae bacterium]MEB2318228.1 hypothetical protein [Pseudomonadota bacterium]
MSRNSKHEKQPAGEAGRNGETDAKAVREREAKEAREDAQAARQDRPGTGMPAQRQRWEDEGGQPSGVLSSTDGSKPKKPDD